MTTLFRHITTEILDTHGSAFLTNYVRRLIIVLRYNLWVQHIRPIHILRKVYIIGISRPNRKKCYLQNIVLFI